MNLVRLIFTILSTVVTIYSVLCTIRILLTWIPGMENGFTYTLKRICDPYLTYFSRRGLLRFGQLDFSPLLSLGLLAFASTIFSSIAAAQKITVGIIFALIIKMAWNIISSVTGFFLVLLIIRLIALQIQRNSYSKSTIWKQIDYIINPIIYAIAKIFSRGKLITYKSSLIIAIIVIFILQSVCSYFFVRIAALLTLIPF